MNLILYPGVKEIKSKMGYQIISLQPWDHIIVYGQNKGKMALSHRDLLYYDLSERKYFELMKEKDIEFTGESVLTLHFKNLKSATRAMYLFLEMACESEWRMYGER
jgi:hypothetical protein